MHIRRSLSLFFATIVAVSVVIILASSSSRHHLVHAITYRQTDCPGGVLEIASPTSLMGFSDVKQCNVAIGPATVLPVTLSGGLTISGALTDCDIVVRKINTPSVSLSATFVRGNITLQDLTLNAKHPMYAASTFSDVELLQFINVRRTYSAGSTFGHSAFFWSTQEAKRTSIAAVRLIGCRDEHSAGGSGLMHVFFRVDGTTHIGTFEVRNCSFKMSIRSTSSGSWRMCRVATGSTMQNLSVSNTFFEAGSRVQGTNSAALTFLRGVGPQHVHIVGLHFAGGMYMVAGSGIATFYPISTGQQLVSAVLRDIKIDQLTIVGLPTSSFAALLNIGTVTNNARSISITNVQMNFFQAYVKMHIDVAVLFAPARVISNASSIAIEDVHVRVGGDAIANTNSSGRASFAVAAFGGMTNVTEVRVHSCSIEVVRARLVGSTDAAVVDFALHLNDIGALTFDNLSTTLTGGDTAFVSSRGQAMATVLHFADVGNAHNIGALQLSNSALRGNVTGNTSSIAALFFFSRNETSNIASTIVANCSVHAAVRTIVAGRVSAVVIDEMNRTAGTQRASRFEVSNIDVIGRIDVVASHAPAAAAAAAAEKDEVDEVSGVTIFDVFGKVTSVVFSNITVEPTIYGDAIANSAGGSSSSVATDLKATAAATIVGMEDTISHIDSLRVANCRIRGLAASGVIETRGGRIAVVGVNLKTASDIRQIEFVNVSIAVCAVTSDEGSIFVVVSFIHSLQSIDVFLIADATLNVPRVTSRTNKTIGASKIAYVGLAVFISSVADCRKLRIQSAFVGAGTVATSTANSFVFVFLVEGAFRQSDELSVDGASLVVDEASSRSNTPAVLGGQLYQGAQRVALLRFANIAVRARVTESLGATVLLFASGSGISRASAGVFFSNITIDATTKQLTRSAVNIFVMNHVTADSGKVFQFLTNISSISFRNIRVVASIETETQYASVAVAFFGGIIGVGSIATHDVVFDVAFAEASNGTRCAVSTTVFTGPVFAVARLSWRHIDVSVAAPGGGGGGGGVVGSARTVVGDISVVIARSIGPFIFSHSSFPAVTSMHLSIIGVRVRSSNTIRARESLQMTMLLMAGANYSADTDLVAFASTVEVVDCKLLLDEHALSVEEDRARSSISLSIATTWKVQLTRPFVAISNITVANCSISVGVSTTMVGDTMTTVGVDLDTAAIQRLRYVRLSNIHLSLLSASATLPRRAFLLAVTATSLPSSTSSSASPSVFIVEDSELSNTRGSCFADNCSFVFITDQGAPFSSSSSTVPSASDIRLRFEIHNNSNSESSAAASLISISAESAGAANSSVLCSSLPSHFSMSGNELGSAAAGSRFVSVEHPTAAAAASAAPANFWRLANTTWSIAENDICNTLADDAMPSEIRRFVRRLLPNGRTQITAFGCGPLMTPTKSKSKSHSLTTSRSRTATLAATHSKTDASRTVHASASASLSASHHEVEFFSIPLQTAALVTAATAAFAAGSIGAMPAEASVAARTISSTSMIGGCRNPQYQIEGTDRVRSAWLWDPLPFPLALIPNLKVGAMPGAYLRGALLAYALLMLLFVALAYGMGTRRARQWNEYEEKRHSDAMKKYREEQKQQQKQQKQSQKQQSDKKKTNNNNGTDESNSNSDTKTKTKKSKKLQPPQRAREVSPLECAPILDFLGRVVAATASQFGTVVGICLASSTSLVIDGAVFSGAIAVFFIAVAYLYILWVVQDVVPRPLVVKVALFFPAQPSGAFQRRVRAFLNSAAGKFVCVGKYAWLAPTTSAAPKNPEVILPTRGALAHLGNVLTRVWGPRLKSSHNEDDRRTEFRAAPFFIITSITVNLITSVLVGVAKQLHTSCNAVAFVIFALNTLMCLYCFLVRPMLVPMRTIFALVLEALSLVVSLLAVPGVVGDDADTTANATKGSLISLTVLLGMRFALKGFGIVLRQCAGKSHFVSIHAMRRHLTSLLDSIVLLPKSDGGGDGDEDNTKRRRAQRHFEALPSAAAAVPIGDGDGDDDSDAVEMQQSPSPSPSPSPFSPRSDDDAVAAANPTSDDLQQQLLFRPSSSSASPPRRSASGRERGRAQSRSKARK